MAAVRIRLFYGMTDATASPAVYYRVIYETSSILDTMHNESGYGVHRTYSPIMLNTEWSKVGRLLFMVCCTSFGSTMNGFFISSFFIERTLRKVGNIFLACTGLADFMITSAVMSVSSVVLLSMGQWDTLPVCQAMLLVTETATYAYSIFFLLAATENYYRICRTKDEYNLLKSLPIALMSILIFCLSFGISVAGVVNNLDYDYCERKFYGNITFRISTVVVFHGIPMILTLSCLFTALVHVQRRARRQIQYKRSHQYERDYSITSINITAYILFVIGWIPYLVIVHEFPNASDSKYYSFAWLGLFRTIFTSVLYAITNRNFRRAFGHLFNYCFCKNSLSSSYSNRHRRMLDYTPGLGDINVHVMHRVVSACSSRRGIFSSREIYDL